MDRVNYSYCIDVTSAQMVYAELVKKLNFSWKQKIVKLSHIFYILIFRRLLIYKSELSTLTFRNPFPSLAYLKLLGKSLIEKTVVFSWITTGHAKVLVWGFCQFQTSYATVWHLVNTRNIINRIFIVLNHLNTIDSTYE